MGRTIYQFENQFNIQSPVGNWKQPELSYRDKIENLLKVNNITGFIYTNTIKGILGNDIPISVYGRLINSKLDLQFSSGAFMPDMNPGIVTGLNYLNESMRYLVVQTKNDGWELYDKKIDPRFITRNWSDISGRKPMTTTEEENRQIYNEFVDAKFGENGNNPSKEFGSICSKINKQLDNKFYSGTQIYVYVKRVDQNGKTIEENTLKTKYDDTPFEVKLNVTLKPDGSVEIKHVLSNTYLNEYVKKWVKEANARGLEDINIEELRKQVIQDFEAIETEKAFYQKFIQDAKAILSDKIAGYVEGVQATQKIAKNVWDIGAINRSTWYSKEDEYKQWPKYIRFEPIIGGATDGVIDEIVGIPVAIKGIYGIVTDDKQREAIKGMFSKEGAGKLLDGLKNEVNEIKKEPERQEHFAGQATIAVVEMVTGYSIFSKGGKLTEVLDKTTDGIKKFLNPKVVKLFEDFKKIFKYQPENRKAFESVIRNETQEAIEVIGEEILSDKKLYVEVVQKTIRWALGKKFEKSITAKFREEMIEHSDFFTNFAVKAGTTVDELKLMQRIEQLQIYLPNGSFTVVDDVFVKTTIIENKKVYQVILNETKLSKDAPFTTNQDKLIELLNEGKTDFVIRSKRPEITDIISTNSTITIKSYVKTVGEGVDDATKSVFETIK